MVLSGFLLVSLPLWGYSVFSKSFTDFGSSFLLWCYSLGCFQAFCLFFFFCLLWGHPWYYWVFWRSFNICDTFLLLLSLFGILWGVLCLVRLFLGLWHCYTFFPWALTGFLLFFEATLCSLNLFQTLCCFVVFCLAPLFQTIFNFPSIWRALLWSFSISVFNQFSQFLWDFSVSSGCLSSSLLFSLTILYSLGHLQTLSCITRLSKSICCSLGIFHTYFCFIRVLFWRRMREDGERDLFRDARASRALDFNCTGVGIDLCVTFWNLFCSPLVLVVVGVRREMSSKRRLLKNPLFLYHPSKNLLYKGESRYCIEETLVQTSPGGNGMLFLSVYYLLHNRWLAHRQTSPGFPHTSYRMKLLNSMERDYIRVMCALFHAAPKNHLLGKPHFPSCLLYAWLICCPRKTTRISSAALCLHLSCVWVCISCTEMGSGHRTGELA